MNAYGRRGAAGPRRPGPWASFSFVPLESIDDGAAPLVVGASPGELTLASVKLSPLH